MKITQRQLKRLINEMYHQGPGVTLSKLDALTVKNQDMLAEIESLYAAADLELPAEIDELADLFSELLFPLFNYAEGGSGAPTI